MLKSLIFLACLPLFFACSHQEVQTNTEDSKKDSSFRVPISEDKKDIQEQVRLEQKAKEQKFLSSGLKTDIADETGLVLDIDWESRFYPYAILVWHEIVNDSIWDTHFSVTFCPLCGSWIVFDRELESRIVDFGVSGKL